MPEIQEEEIDLREYINVLLKRKGIIILIFLIAVITAAIVSYFIIEPVYQANTAIAVSKPKIGNSIVSEPSLEDYKNLITNNVLEEELIQKLNLNKPPLELTPYDLEQMLTIELPNGINLIKMNLQASNSKLTKDIINSWATLFIERNKRLYFDEVKMAKTGIEEKLKLAEREFFEIEEKLMKFDETGNAKMIEDEINYKISRILSYKSRLVDIQISLEKENAKKEQIITSINEQEKVLKLNKSVVDDQFFQQLISNLTDANLKIDNLTYISEVTNPIYYNLTQQLISTNISINSLIAEENQLRKNINDFGVSLENLKKELTEKKLILAKLNREYSAKEKLYNIFYKQAEEVQLTETAEENLLKIASLAYEPKFPIKPNKKLNILIAGVLGLFVGVFVAFFLEFWQKGK
ncbi:MAG: Wzz/FepE/Etk N-terminal domain-containing protein [Candidatus Lokiarchaeota archaeon]|nr:Wzz/FepE/Etk N-terminal domain-containing protein [Candidatus Lokiarchaeota archaeon]